MSGLGLLAGRLAICVDFGTSCSGYVIKEPGMATTETLEFNAPGMKSGVVKAPSDIAFRVASKHSKPSSAVIGKKALKKAAEGDPHIAHFSRYKMGLYDGTSKSSKGMVVRASNGSKHPLLAVISTALGLIRAEAVKKVERSGHDRKRINWIITVPAMAADEQLAFMREAAVMAGMVSRTNSERLTLVAEPEAACAYMATQPMMATAPIGSTVAVLDCGGGTHDFVALKILSRTPFKAEFVSESLGGAGGAADVNEAFYREMSLFVSRGASDTALQEKPEVFGHLWKIVEDAKKQLNSDPDGAMVAKLDFLVTNGCITRDELPECIEAYNKRIGYTALTPLRRGIGARFAARLFRDIIHKVINPIAKLARSFLRDTHFDYVIAVGGFAESELLKKRLQAVVGRERLLVPANPSTCVARGGISLMGAEIERMCRFTYGTNCNISWSNRFEGVRGAEKVTDEDGALRCRDAFDRNIARRTKISPGWSSAEKIYTPTSSTQTAVAFPIFRSREEDPILVAGQEKLGELRVEIDAETMRLPRDDREFGVSWTWEKEIVMIVTRKRDGRQWRMRIDVE